MPTQLDQIHQHQATLRSPTPSTMQLVLPLGLLVLSVACVSAQMTATAQQAQQLTQARPAQQQNDPVQPAHDPNATAMPPQPAAQSQHDPTATAMAPIPAWVPSGQAPAAKPPSTLATESPTTARTSTETPSSHVKMVKSTEGSGGASRDSNPSNYKRNSTKTHTNRTATPSPTDESGAMNQWSVRSMVVSMAVVFLAGALASP